MKNELSMGEYQPEIGDGIAAAKVFEKAGIDLFNISKDCRWFTDHLKCPGLKSLLRKNNRASRSESRRSRHDTQ